MEARDVIADVRARLAGDPVYLAGSLVAADTHGTAGWHDVDLFVPTQNVLIATGQKLLCQGFTFGERFDRVWARWLKYGMKGWHTNSLRLMSPDDIEYNLVYKLADGHPTTSLGQVLESFDFGLLGTGWDLEANVFRDIRPYLFPGLEPWDALPMMPNKRDAWRNGFISQYNGLREAGRYAKYHGYGFDMSLVKDDLVTGYWAASSYLTNHFDSDKQMLGRIYEAIAIKIEDDAIAELDLAAKQIDYKDALDQIMEALE